MLYYVSLKVVLFLWWYAIDIVCLQFFIVRERDEEDSDIRDLVMSFSGLEEKVLEQYTFAKVQLKMLSKFVISIPFRHHMHIPTATCDSLILSFLFFIQ